MKPLTALIDDLKSRSHVKASAVTLLTLCFSSIGVAQPPAAKPVVVARVVETEVNSGHRVVGTVTPLRTSTIGSAVDGRVQEFLINQGDEVTVGQVLAKLRTETLEIELAAAEAELTLSKHRLAELKNGSLPETIAEAEANMLGAQAAVENADTRLSRIQSLATTRSASSADLDDARQQAAAAQFAFQATKALYQRIKQGPRAEMIAQASAQVELQKQRRNLLNDRINKFTIRSPFAGFVSAEFTEIGAWIARGDPIAQIIQMDEVEIQAPVTAEAVVNLRKGDVVRIEFPELPNELLTGSIDRIVPVAESRARTFPVHIRLKNRIRDGTPMLLAGMLARVDLPAGQRQKLPLVPKDALVLNEDDRAVFVVDVEANSRDRIGKVRKVSVDLGVAVNERIQVRGDIQVDDLVVVVGNERLVPNSEVQLVEQTGENESRIR